MLSTLPAPIPLTWNEALSGIFGSVSLASWIFLLVPQLIENYRQGNADGISLTFLLIWFAGDVANLAGALWAGLVPTVIALAVYFCFADVTLITQCVYYNTLSKNRQAKAHGGTESGAEEVTANGHINGSAAAANDRTAEQLPLLSSSSHDLITSPHSVPKRRMTGITEANLGLPGSRRPSSSRRQRRSVASQNSAPLESILDVDHSSEREPSTTRTWLKNTLSIFLILAAGTVGWTLAWKAGVWRPTPAEHGSAGGSEDDLVDIYHPAIGAEILGYASAVLYLGARIPQIMKNQRERSCEGLSLLFFLLSLVGNATYGAGILFHSLQRSYVLTNLPWLIGSLGTMAEDAIIFFQFSVFGDKSQGAQRGDEEDTSAVE